MALQVLRIERNDAKGRGRREFVYDVTVEIDAKPYIFEVLVGVRSIGSDPVPYATFRNPDALRVFAADHRPITEILRKVTAVHNRELVALPTPTVARL